MTVSDQQSLEEILVFWPPPCWCPRTGGENLNGKASGAAGRSQLVAFPLPACWAVGRRGSTGKFPVLRLVPCDYLKKWLVCRYLTELLLFKRQVVPIRIRRAIGLIPGIQRDPGFPSVTQGYRNWHFVILDPVCNPKARFERHLY